MRVEKKPMGSDMIVALGPATVNRSTLFGLNGHASARQSQRLVLEAGRAHAPGEKVQVQFIELPQCRQTSTTLGCRPNGCWGYQHGLNDHHVAAGFAVWQTLLRCNKAGLTGTDLVRLMLERAASARQAVDVLTDLVQRHGQGSFPGQPDGQDSVFLIADPREAFVVEAAGNYWAVQEIGQVRAAGDVGVIRRDWYRLSPGFSEFAINAGHWPEDGSKLDFAGSVSADPTGRESALRRWGRATLLLEGQNGHIDLDFCRKLLGDHYEGTHFEVDPLKPATDDPVPLCRHDAGAGRDATRVSFLAELTGREDAAQLVWHAFGPPCLNLYFPIFLAQPGAGDGFASFLDQHAQNLRRLSDHLGRCVGREADRWEMAAEKISWLQVRFEEETDDFVRDLARLRTGGGDGLTRQIQLFLQRHAEQFEDTVQSLVRLSVVETRRLAMS